MAQQDDAHQPEGQAVAAVLASFFPASTNDWSARDKEVSETSMKWQQIGFWAPAAEMHGTINGVRQGRLAEIVGQIAAAGEQLGLALTCTRDANVWLSRADDLAQGIAARALSEMAAYYLLGVGHALGNITLRILSVHAAAVPELSKAFPNAKGFTPFTDDRNAWPSFGSRVGRAAKAASDRIAKQTVEELVGALTGVLEDDRWTKAVGRRGGDYHRWRAQSVDGGVPQEDPWVAEEDGTLSLTVYAKSPYSPPDFRQLVADTDAALNALHAAMRSWLDVFPQALADLGVPAFHRAADEDHAGADTFSSSNAPVGVASVTFPSGPPRLVRRTSLDDADIEG